MGISQEQYNEILERLENIEFRQQLLFEDNEVSRILFEYEITKLQYRKIMDLMDDYRKKINSKKKVSHGEFERNIYDIVPKENGNYHFCEEIALAFKEEHRWEEVFENLYGNMPKYNNLKI